MSELPGKPPAHILRIDLEYADRASLLRNLGAVMAVIANYPDAPVSGPLPIFVNAHKVGRCRPVDTPTPAQQVALDRLQAAILEVGDAWAEVKVGLGSKL